MYTYKNFELYISYDIPFEVFVSIQLLNAFELPLSFTAMMEHIFKISPKEIRMTMNAIMTAMYFQFSALVGYICGSKIYEVYGGANLFFGHALICGTWAVLMIMYHGRVKIARIYFYIQQHGNYQVEANHDIRRESSVLDLQETVNIPPETIAVTIGEDGAINYGYERESSIIHSQERFNKVKETSVAKRGDNDVSQFRSLASRRHSASEAQIPGDYTVQLRSLASRRRSAPGPNIRDDDIISFHFYNNLV